MSVADQAALKRILAITASAPAQVYSPSDDSFLMVDAIAQIPLTGKTVLDMGTGSGILGLYCVTRGAKVTASDIDETAIEQVNRTAEAIGLKINLLVSDLFSHIPGRFDLILFNPPYLPSLRVNDRSVDGGQGGTTLADRFLKELPEHLERGAYALLLLSSMNHPAYVQLRHRGLEFATLVRKSLFFEELQVLRVRLRDDLTV